MALTPSCADLVLVAGRFLAEAAQVELALIRKARLLKVAMVALALAVMFVAAASA